MRLLTVLSFNWAFYIAHSLLLRNREHDSRAMQLIAFDCGILHGPPNSLLAAQRALQAGATALNIDLALTRDGQLVAAHSSTHWLHLEGLPEIGLDLSTIDFHKVPRTPPCSAFRDFYKSIGIAEDDLIDLQDCEPQALSTAEDFFRAFPGVPLHFDLKANSLEQQKQQAQLLDALLRQKFPERIQASAAPSTSVRLFEDPRRLVSPKDFSFMQRLISNFSVAVFLGDPADELGPYPTGNRTRNEAELGLLHVLDKGPRGVPSGVRGVYLPSKVMAQGWTIPHAWGHKLFLVCDVAAEGLPTLDERKSQEKTCLRAGASGLHTAFFRGLVTPERERLEGAAANSSLSLGFFRSSKSVADGWSMEFQGGPAASGPLPSIVGHTWKGRNSWARCVTKLVTAMLVLRLIEMGKLKGLDVPAVEIINLSSDLLPVSKRRVLQRLTLRQVMVGVGGFQSISDHPDWEISHGASAANLSAFALSHVDTIHLLLKDTFIYSNQAWVVVERAIEVATGLPLPSAARQYLFDELGLSKNTYYSDDGQNGCPEYRGETQRQRNLRAAIGLCTTLDDLVLISQTLVEGPGKIAGVSPRTQRRVLSSWSVEELLVDQLAKHFPQAVPNALKARPIRHFIDQGFPVVGRSLGAYILDDDIVMAHGGDSIYVGTKIFIRKQNGRPEAPAMVQMPFVDHQYNGHDDFMAHVPETLREMCKCYALLFGAAAPWHQASLRNPGYEPPCAKYEAKKLGASR